MDDRVRQLQPLLPVLVAHLEDRYSNLRALLQAAPPLASGETGAWPGGAAAAGDRPVPAEVEELVDRSKGKICADKAHEKITAMGYGGLERTTRRAVAELKTAWRAGRRRVHRPWIPEPGMQSRVRLRRRPGDRHDADGAVLLVAGVVAVPGGHPAAGQDLAERGRRGRLMHHAHVCQTAGDRSPVAWPRVLLSCPAPTPGAASPPASGAALPPASAPSCAASGRGLRHERQGPGPQTPARQRGTAGPHLLRAELPARPRG
jgi:hypothetical protein